MPEDMARDFNTHAYMRSMSSSTLSDEYVVQQYRKSKCKFKSSVKTEHTEISGAELKNLFYFLNNVFLIYSMAL